MNDPYLEFKGDKNISDIQVNVFHVKNTLKNMILQEKERLLHNDVYIFNPKDPHKPSIPDIKLPSKYKLLSEKIYLSDTIEILYNKIAMNCLKEDQQLVTGREIFAWIDMNTTKEASLRFSLPLGIKHSDISLFMNPYNEKNYDQDFVNINGSPKRDPKFSLDLYSLYSDYQQKIKEYKYAKPNYNIYFCSAKDILRFISNPPMKNITNKDYLFHGYIRKYFPLVESMISIDSPTKTMEK